MYQSLSYGLFVAKCKTHAFFQKVFKENAGAAELIATLVIVGIVLAIALIFRNQLSDMVGKLWNQLVRDGDTSKVNSNNVVDSWNT